jgi:hypothetical protein
MIPVVKIKCTAAAFDDAADLAQELIKARCTLLGQNPGDGYSERIGGRTFVAKRKYGGGIDLREVMPKRNEYDEQCETEPLLGIAL